MKIERFEELHSWQKALELTVEIYKAFESSRDYGYKDQIQRASVSIMNNIAEGFERKSNKELLQFFYIAKGSAAEVRSMFILSLELKIINQEQYDKLMLLVTDISKLLSGFIKSIS
jgi:four helix bundle protein